MGTTWRLFVDTGGTFTDAVGIAPDGSVHRTKVPSHHPLAPLEAARALTGTAEGAALPPLSMRLATTRGTNALLERRGAPTALFVTGGFADLLRIGTQQRPALFARSPEARAPLHGPVVEVRERLDATGAVLTPLDEEALARDARRALADGAEAAALCLLHAWRNPEHERRAATVLREAGFATVVTSSAVAPHLGALSRGETTVVEATLSAIVSGYVEAVSTGLGGGPLHLLTSAGGLVRAEGFRACDSLLSGPAGGVVGAARAGARSGITRLLAFDMGGTSTDVSRHDGDHEYVFEHTVGDARILSPALAIETVAAGGGSVCGVRNGRLHVGPQSAGADPGPACYGRGGPLTLTDVNLLLGRLEPGRFPLPLRVEAAAAALQVVIETLAATGAAPERDDLLRGFLDIADERMAHAVRRVSLGRGHDPAEHALLAFGGAGGQHACSVAERLGIGTVLVPEDAGLLSAEGLRSAVVERFAHREVLLPLADASLDLDSLLRELALEAMAAVDAESPGAPAAVRRRILRMRFLGQDATLDVEPRSAGDARTAFLDRYEAVFGHLPGARGIEVVSARVVASPAAAAPGDPLPAAAQGERFTGPRLVPGPFGTTWVPAGWAAVVDGAGALRIEHEAAAAVPAARPPGVMRELFTQRLEAVAIDMGTMLRRTAVSTNVKERLDFSCAVLDPGGRLVVNAPHVPVHLGSLGLCIRTLMERSGPSRGDIVVVNHPAFGGSHLPDVTVAAPVHDDEGVLLGWVANRAHHAELGGVRPGSMPPDAVRLLEEGVVLAPLRVVEGGEAHWDRVEGALLGGPHPTRRPGDNLADLRAAVAACRLGEGELRDLARRHGTAEVIAQMDGLLEHAADMARRALRNLGEREVAADDTMDDGTVVAVDVRVREGTLRLDFSRSGDVHAGNLNATPAIVRSAVLYALRLLVDAPLPLNEGLLDPVEIVLRRGSLLDPGFPDDPAECPAVVGGNVETSQRLVDVLLRGLGIAASSQGTMNNVTWGNEHLSFYETLGGGCGATPDAHGGSGMHSHMTNTRITDPEVLEHRYPVRLERWALRRDSGGAGRCRGGDGLVRETTFLESMKLSVLTQRRTQGPPGMEGGGAGAPGRQSLVRSDGTVEELRSLAGADVEPGDRLVMETPGGGGWGRPPC